MKRSSLYALLAAVAFVALLSCAPGKYLRTEHIRYGQDISGTFKVILYGSNHSSDLETVAVLDLEGDGYDIEPYAPVWQYKVLKGIGAGEAVEMARRHVSYHPSYMSARLKRIITSDGAVVGYELRPMYFPLSYGELDVIDVWYVMKDGGKVRMYVTLKDSVDRRVHGGGDSSFSTHEK